MKIQRDSKDQPFIEWQQGASGFKRAWIQRKPGTDKDWANAKDGRYLNVVRVERRGAGPAGNATDFPIFSSLSDRSEEHTSELQSLMRISYAVFCLKKKKKHKHNQINTIDSIEHNTRES